MKYLRRKIGRKVIYSNKIPNIVCDDREKKAWTFNSYRKETKRLKVGDYTFAGFEGLIAIERKANIKELFIDLSGKYRKNFKKFMLNLSKIPVSCIIVEDDLKNINKALGQIKSYMHDTKMSEETIYCWLNQTLFEYKIPVLFIGNTFRKDRQALDCFFSYMLESIRKI